jgi:hypothetical protein
MKNETLKDVAPKTHPSSRKTTPENKHGKNMRRLMKLVCRAFLNPCE